MHPTCCMLTTPSAPTTNRTTSRCLIPRSLPISLLKSWYFSIFSPSFSYTLSFPLSLPFINMFRRLYEVPTTVGFTSAYEPLRFVLCAGVSLLPFMVVWVFWCPFALRCALDCQFHGRFTRLHGNSNSRFVSNLSLLLGTSFAKNVY